MTSSCRNCGNSYRLLPVYAECHVRYSGRGRSRGFQAFLRFSVLILLSTAAMRKWRSVIRFLAISGTKAYAGTAFMGCFEYILTALGPEATRSCTDRSPWERRQSGCGAEWPAHGYHDGVHALGWADDGNAYRRPLIPVSSSI